MNGLLQSIKGYMYVCELALLEKPNLVQSLPPTIYANGSARGGVAIVWQVHV